MQPPLCPLPACCASYRVFCRGAKLTQSERNIVYGMFIKREVNTAAKRKRQMHKMRKLYGLATSGSMERALSRPGGTVSPGSAQLSGWEASSRPNSVMGAHRFELKEEEFEEDEDPASVGAGPSSRVYSLDPALVPNIAHDRRQLVAHRPGASVWRLHGLPQHAVGRDPNITALHPGLIPGGPQGGTQASVWAFRDAGDTLDAPPLPIPRSELVIDIPGAAAGAGAFTQASPVCASPTTPDSVLSPRRREAREGSVPLTSLPWEYTGLYSPGSELTDLPSPPPLSESCQTSGPLQTAFGESGDLDPAGTLKSDVPSVTSPRSQLAGEADATGSDSVDDLLEWSKALSFQDYCENVLGDI